MVGKVSTTKVRQRIGDVLNRVALRHDEFIIERIGKPLAALVPVERLEQMRRFARRHAEDVLEQQKGSALTDDEAMALGPGSAALGSPAAAEIVREGKVSGASRRPGGNMYVSAYFRPEGAPGRTVERFVRHAAFELVLSAEIAAEVLHSLAYPRVQKAAGSI